MSTASTKVYLLDVEGTVAPISLVSEQLFPYARKHLSAFITQHSAEPGVHADLKLLAEENARETDLQCPRLDQPEPVVEQAIVYLLWLMDRDRKSTALKSLQGKIWKIGFESGELKGALFTDVPEAFTRWTENARVAIYSSGSVEAQQQLFRYSIFGDLTPQIAAYFDTRVGPKVEQASYAAIATSLQTKPGEILFCSDVVRELDAAQAAGCKTRLVVRPGNAAVADINGHAIVESFVLL